MPLRSDPSRALRALLSPRGTALGLAAISLLGLLGALSLQFLAGEEPCNLCIWQRYPHLAVVALGLIAWFVWPRPLLALIGLVLAGSAVLAGYHVGIEQGLWALPASCAAGEAATSVAELKQLLQTAPPACDQVSVTFAGLSLAAWNGLASLTLALFALAVAGRGERSRLSQGVPTGPGRSAP